MFDWNTIHMNIDPLTLLTTGTVFTAKSKLDKYRYVFVGVDLKRGAYIVLKNLDLDKDNDLVTIVEHEWFRQRVIEIESTPGDPCKNVDGAETLDIDNCHFEGEPVAPKGGPKA